MVIDFKAIYTFAIIRFAVKLKSRSKHELVIRAALGIKILSSL